MRQQNDDLNTEHDPEWVNLSEHGSVLISGEAGGTVFQVDQAKPQNQKLLRDIRKRGEDSGLDSGVSVRSRGNYEKTTPAPRESLHNSTDFKCQCL